MILFVIAAKLKRRANGEFQGRHYEAALVIRAFASCLCYPLSYRDIEALLLERGLEVEHSTLNRWVLTYALAIEHRLRRFRRPHCGSLRVDEITSEFAPSGATCTAPSTSTALRSTS